MPVTASMAGRLPRSRYRSCCPGVNFNGDLMKLFVSPGGKWTIGVVPAGREGMICTLHHGDGFSAEKPRHEAGVKFEANVDFIREEINDGNHYFQL